MADEKLILNRERNRLHSRNTRVKKKVQLESLQGKIESLIHEKGSLSRQLTGNDGDDLGEDLRAFEQIKTRISQSLSDGDEIDFDRDLLRKDKAKCTSEEIEMIRRERNRMHAKKTRLRKKLLFKEMETVVGNLETEVNELRSQLDGSRKRRREAGEEEPFVELDDCAYGSGMMHGAMHLGMSSMPTDSYMMHQQLQLQQQGGGSYGSSSTFGPMNGAISVDTSQLPHWQAFNDGNMMAPYSNESMIKMLQSQSSMHQPPQQVHIYGQQQLHEQQFHQYQYQPHQSHTNNNNIRNHHHNNYHHHYHHHTNISFVPNGLDIDDDNDRSFTMDHPVNNALQMSNSIIKLENIPELNKSALADGDTCGNTLYRGENNVHFV